MKCHRAGFLIPNYDHPVITTPLKCSTSLTDVLLLLPCTMLMWCGNISLAMPLKPPDRRAQVSQTGLLTLDWMGFPSLSWSPVHNAGPKWFLHSDPPFMFVQLSVLKRGDPKALSSRGDTEHCRVCCSLQTSSSSFDDPLIPMGLDLKTVLDLAEPSGPGSLLSSQHTPTFKP